MKFHLLLKYLRLLYCLVSSIFVIHKQIFSPREGFSSEDSGDFPLAAPNGLSSTQALNRDQHVSLLVTYFLAFSGDFLRGLSAITAPLLAVQLGATNEQIGLVSAAYGITYCFMPFLMGKLSDRIGRRRSIRIAFWMYAINSIVYISSTNIGILVGAAIMEGVSLSFLWPSIGSMVVELSPEAKKKRNVDTYMNSWNLGSLVGPLFAGTIFGIAGAQITFLGLTAMCIICLILIRAFLVVERYVPNYPIEKNDVPLSISPSAAGPSEFGVPLHRSQDNRKYLLFAFGMILLSSIYMAILSSYYAGYAGKYSPYRDSSIGAFLIGFTVFSFPIGRGISFFIMDRVSLANKVNMVPFMTVAALLLTYAITLTFEVGYLIIIFPILGFISGFGFCGGFSIITDLAPDRKGAYTGIAESIVGVSFFVGQFVPFLILGPNALSPFWFAMIVLIILTVVFTFLRIAMPRTPHE